MSSTWCCWGNDHVGGGPECDSTGELIHRGNQRNSVGDESISLSCGGGRFSERAGEERRNGLVHSTVSVGATLARVKGITIYFDISIKHHTE